MLKSRLLFLSLAIGSVTALQAQKLPTATRSVDIQAGGGFVYGHSDYGTDLKGYMGYATVDFKPHLGLELAIHQANGADNIYERTYEVGGRYVKHYGRVNPYAKAMYGRGVFNFPPPSTNPSLGYSANLAYNLLGVGGGVDYKLRSYLNLRGDFEYQFWGSSPGFLPNGLSPYLLTIGAAYHFR